MPTLHLGRLVVVPLALVAAPAAHAQGVRIVDRVGDRNFTDIQDAVDAAQEGEVLLVGPGTYSSFTLDGKGLTVAGHPGGGARVVGLVEVRNVSTEAVLSHLVVSGATDGPGVHVASCSGDVRLQSCAVDGRWDGLFVEASAHVAALDCTFQAGSGYATYAGVDCWYGYVALFRCTARGGDGYEGYFGEDGGHGVNLLSSGLFASGCTFAGGDGGEGLMGPGGNGGHGVHAPQGAVNLDSTATGGAAGYSYQGPYPSPGAPWAYLPTTLAGPARIGTSALIASDELAPLATLEGASLDRVFLLRALGLDLEANLPATGVWMITRPFFTQNVPIGVLSGPSAAFALPTVRLAPTQAAALDRVQLAARDASGSFRLYNGLSTVTLNRDVGPDCDANGVSDYVEVLEGTAADANGDWIPDACQTPYSGPIWHVDVSAAPGGNGSQGQPFRGLRAAFLAAQTGHEIVVAPGLYRGAENRELDFGPRILLVRSSNGPEQTIVDCESLGRGFAFTGNVDRSCVLSGLTIRNGNTIPSIYPTNLGGGVLVRYPARPTIANCIVEDCYAESGGGAVYLGGSALLRDCILRRNTADNTLIGGGGAFVFDSHADVVGCLFEDNWAAGDGGGLLYVDVRPSAVPGNVSHCDFRANECGDRGGGLALKWWGTFINEQWVTNCLFAGNRAAEGGGVAFLGTTHGVLSQCTLTANSAVSLGGGVLTGNPGANVYDVRIADCVLWGNQAPSGHELAHVGGTVTMVANTVQGGLAAIAASGPLTYGPGHLTADPLFLDPAGPDGDPATFGDNDYRLGPGSPAVDAAYTAEVLPDVFDLDGDGDFGEPIPLDLLGSARFVEVPAAPNTGVGPPPLSDMGAYEQPYP